ncbi:dihydropteroate synthase [Bacillus suaedaesalsae]|uniref:Dihydropteroate synthase n=1 Tax=Bacillus suaedaesalsae TaxID=2810349 RepID=A0ABS2DCA0_9BACI|nr:dihydropteroate synthase [Bacillus suaedaesalsae]MBM6616079.1 dihydropteroate synthase [Bacillus suaedaesalsae]
MKYSTITCDQYNLDVNQKTLIMGILNVTPDSFSDGGSYNQISNAIEHAKEMIEEGADIIDIGGESTRPGYTVVSAEEEIKRTIPVIKELAKQINVPISIDTYKSEVAKQAVEAGAHIINDIWGAKADPKMAKLAAHYNVPIILMHNRDNKNYTNLMNDVITDLIESIEICKNAGVKDEQIILDPGIGFAKNFEMNIEVMQNLDRISDLGYPVLLGTSRKSFIGQILDVPPIERMEGTGATVCLGIQKGCHIMRVHDVKSISKMTKVMDVLVGKGENSSWIK